MLNKYAVLRIVLCTVSISNVLLSGVSYSSQEIKNANALQERNYPESAAPSPQGPLIKDHTLKVELILKGLTYATDMAFLDPDNILVTEKDTGVVRRILNGVMLQKPLLDVNVATYGHRGMLGIAVSNNNNNFLCTDKIGTNNYDTDSVFSPKNVNVIPKYVFLFYTAAQREDGEDITQGKQPLGNVVYRYEFVDNKLINPKLLLDLPSTPGAIGNGGKILVNPEDKNLYITIGGVGVDAHKTKAQNVKNGEEPDGTSGILVINQDGKPVMQNDALGKRDPLNKYYAYGIWNSFGVDFDPLTGKLWDTENGVIFGDEINLVYPGFNSGWSKIDGIWLRGYAIKDAEAHIASTTTINNSLLDFNEKGKYSPPEITWFNDVGPTAIRFFNSDKLGKQYENDIFVGDIINGNIYHFDLNKKRTELLFSPNSPLSDGVVSSNESTINDELALAKGFGGITDIEVGPKDGYLYILAFNNGEGTMYRIVPNNSLMQ
jgi:glucose/arabinose dehydrogenase